MLTWLFRRRKKVDATALVASIVATTDTSVHPDGLDAIEDCDGKDFAAYETDADTRSFLDWHTTQFASGRGLTWTNVANRYQVYCVQHRCRPLRKGQLLLQLGEHGVIKRRPRIEGRRITCYDIVARPRLACVA